MRRGATRCGLVGLGQAIPGMVRLGSVRFAGSGCGVENTGSDRRGADRQCAVWYGPKGRCGYGLVRYGL